MKHSIEQHSTARRAQCAILSSMYSNRATALVRSRSECCELCAMLSTSSNQIASHTPVLTSVAPASCPPSQLLNTDLPLLNKPAKYTAMFHKHTRQEVLTHGRIFTQSQAPKPPTPHPHASSLLIDDFRSNIPLRSCSRKRRKSKRRTRTIPRLEPDFIHLHMLMLILVRRLIHRPAMRPCRKLLSRPDQINPGVSGVMGVSGHVDVTLSVRTSRFSFSA